MSAKSIRRRTAHSATALAIRRHSSRITCRRMPGRSLRRSLIVLKSAPRVAGPPSLAMSARGGDSALNCYDRLPHSGEHSSMFSSCSEQLPLRAHRSLLNRINVPRPSSRRAKNISVSIRPKSPAYSLLSRPKRGAFRDRHGRGAGCGGRRCAIDEQRVRRTAKSCGPDAPALASSS
jgi:hypothetical protein